MFITETVRLIKILNNSMFFDTFTNKNVFTTKKLNSVENFLSLKPNILKIIIRDTAKLVIMYFMTEDFQMFLLKMSSSNSYDGTII